MNFEEDAFKPVNKNYDYSSIELNLNSQILNFAYCTHKETKVNYNITDEYRLSILKDLVEKNEQENEIYFYHTNHLGSSSWITDALGDVNQHLQQLPYGEDFIDQRQGSFDARYQFTGKERDAATGFQYFGARYYNSDISVWLSVDPMSDKYPSLSPYNYCAGNPVMLVDPDGKAYGDPPQMTTDLYGDSFKSGHLTNHDIGKNALGALAVAISPLIIFGAEYAASVAGPIAARGALTAVRAANNPAVQTAAVEATALAANAINPGPEEIAPTPGPGGELGNALEVLAKRVGKSSVGTGLLKNSNKILEATKFAQSKIAKASGNVRFGRNEK